MGEPLAFFQPTELASTKRVETFLIEDIEQLKQKTIRSFFTPLPFLHGGG